MRHDDCPEERDWIAFADAQLSPEEHARLRGHLAECGRCRREHDTLVQLARDVAAPVPLSDTTATTAAVMARLDHAAPLAPLRSRWRRPLATATLFAAMAAGLLFMLLRDPRPDVQARGGKSPASLARDVGLSLNAPLGQPPLAPGAKLSSGALITASYRCLRPRAYLLMFAVDAKDEVHWLYPAYLDARSDPESFLLTQKETETALAESPVLEVPTGPARIIAVVTSSPLHVSDIERAPAKTLTAAQLVTRWPTASIREWPLAIVAPAAGDRAAP